MTQLRSAQLTQESLFKRDVLIPKKLHFIWLGSILNDFGRNNILKWKIINPYYMVFLWIDSSLFHQVQMLEYQDLKEWAKKNIIIMCDVNLSPAKSDGLAQGRADLLAKENMPNREFYFEETIGQYRNLAAASDILRAEFEYREGGVYCDVKDVFPGAPLGQIIALHGFYCRGSDKNINNDVIGSVAYGAVIALYRDRINKNYQDLYGNQTKLIAHRNPEFSTPLLHGGQNSRLSSTLKTSGPGVLSVVVLNFLQNGMIEDETQLFFDNKYFTLPSQQAHSWFDTKKTFENVFPVLRNYVREYFNALINAAMTKIKRDALHDAIFIPSGTLAILNQLKILMNSLSPAVPFTVTCQSCFVYLKKLPTAVAADFAQQYEIIIFGLHNCGTSLPILEQWCRENMDVERLSGVLDSINLSKDADTPIEALQKFVRTVLDKPNAPDLMRFQYYLTPQSNTRAMLHRLELVSSPDDKKGIDENHRRQIAGDEKEILECHRKIARLLKRLPSGIEQNKVINNFIAEISALTNKQKSGFLYRFFSDRSRSDSMVDIEWELKCVATIESAERLIQLFENEHKSRDIPQERRVLLQSILMIAEKYPITEMARIKTEVEAQISRENGDLKNQYRDRFRSRNPQYDFWSAYHTPALNELIMNRHMTLDDAMDEVSNLDFRQVDGITQGLRRTDVLELTQHEIAALLNLRHLGLTAQHLRESKPYPNYFSYGHHDALIYLIRDRIMPVEDALIIVRGITDPTPAMGISIGLSPSEVKELNNDQIFSYQALKDRGLTAQHLISWKICHIDDGNFTGEFGFRFSSAHTRALVFLMIEQGLKPDKAIFEINRLNAQQVFALIKLYPVGLRGNDLREWTANKFSYEHRDALCDIVDKKGLAPDMAVAELNSRSADAGVALRANLRR